jgi:hypothetical protein
MEGMVMAADTQVAATFNLVDVEGVKASLHMPAFVDGTTTLAAAKTALLAQAVLLDAVTGAKVLRSELTLIQPDRTGLKGSALEGSTVTATGILDYDNATTTFVYGSIIPGVADEILTDTIPTNINPANAAFIAYDAALRAAWLGGHFTDRSYLTLRNLVKTLFRRRVR